MSVSVIIAAFNQWEEYTKPLIKSIWKYEPKVEIVVVDSDSQPPYPDLSYVVKTGNISYGEAINVGVKNSNGDWILSLNNDVLCEGPFVEYIEGLNPDSIYGRQIIEEMGYRWLGNWLALIPRGVWNAVGGFDPNFKKCGFEDADFCVRAKLFNNIDTKPVDLPFHHFWGKTRWQDPQYPRIRQENIEYFEKKHGFRLGNNMAVTHD